MPRGKFIQSMIVNVFAICLGTAVNLLALFCAIKARENTTPPGPAPTTPTYNASQSTICAIFLIVEVYIINTVRAARPQFQFPAILAAIFVSVSMSYGVLFTDVPTAISFMKRLLVTFLTGFGLATGVSLLIFPMSSREIVFKEMTGYVETTVVRSLTQLCHVVSKLSQSCLRSQSFGSSA